MIDDDGELDISSDPSESRIVDSSMESKHRSQSKKMLRVYFGCCRTYAAIPMPEKIRNRQLAVWRVHCVRCGRLVEIPL